MAKRKVSDKALIALVKSKKVKGGLKEYAKKELKRRGVSV